MNSSHCEHKSYYLIDCNKCILLGYKLGEHVSKASATSFPGFSPTYPYGERTWERR